MSEWPFICKQTGKPCPDLNVICWHCPIYRKKKEKKWTRA